MNKIILQGNLTRDPDLKYFRDENAFSRVGIAVSRRYSKNKEVDFFNLVAFGKYRVVSSGSTVYQSYKKTVL